MFQAIRDRLNSDEEGFTLIELLVVVIIIGILAAIAIPTFLSQREGAGESAAQSDLRNAAIAQEAYFTENNAYGNQADLTEFVASSDVTMAIFGDAATSTTPAQYCMSAVHANSPNTTYKLQQAQGSPVTGTACTAATG